MKVFICLSVLFACTYGSLLGANRCTYGPSYWCENIKNAKECSAVSHCTRAWKLKVLDENDSEICTFCEDMVKDIKDYISKNATKETITAYMKKGCSYFPDSFSQSECTKIAEHYFGEFYQMIEQGVNPKAICQFATLCSNSTKSTTNLMKSSPVGGAQCEACKALMVQLKKEINDPNNQALLIKYGQIECEKLGSLADVCKQMVKEYMSDVVSFADTNLGGTVCFLLGVCSSSNNQQTPVIDYKALAIAAMKQAKIPERIQSLSRSLNTGDDKYCDTCEEVFGYLKIVLNNNATQQEIKQLIEDDLCPQLGQLQDMCKGIVDQYLPKVWDQIIAALDPATVCKELGLCTNSTTGITKQSSVKLTTQPKSTSSIECVICEFVINKLEGLITSNSTEEDIVKALEKVCSILPGTIRGECDSFIDKYGPMIIKLILNEASPDTICTALGLCSSLQQPAMQLKLSSENCIVCELAMGYLKKILENTKTDDDIVKKLEQICTYLSPELTTSCQTVLSTYGVKMLQMIASKVNAKGWCADLGLCSASMYKSDGLVHLYNRQFN